MSRSSYTCVTCSCSITEKNTVGINKKLLGKQTKSFYCMECLADYLGVTVEELEEKIAEFREEGCTLFS